MDKLIRPIHFNKIDIFVALLALLCLSEAVQMPDFSKPLFPSFQPDPVTQFHRALREDILCAKTELESQKATQFYFLNEADLVNRDLLFENFYTSYLLAPEIVTTKDENSQYAIAVVDPEKIGTLQANYPYELLKQCGNSGIVILQKK
jgi:hypothetical protein